MRREECQLAGEGGWQIVTMPHPLGFLCKGLNLVYAQETFVLRSEKSHLSFPTKYNLKVGNSMFPGDHSL